MSDNIVEGFDGKTYLQKGKLLFAQLNPKEAKPFSVYEPISNVSTHNSYPVSVVYPGTYYVFMGFIAELDEFIIMDPYAKNYILKMHLASEFYSITSCHIEYKRAVKEYQQGR